MDSCKVCGSNFINKEITAQENRKMTGERFDYFRCQNCDCLQIATITDLSARYQNNYYSFQQDKINYRSTEWMNKVNNISKKLKSRSPFFNRHFQHELIRYFKIPTTAKILDIGCGAGQYLLPLSFLGFDSLMGQDPYTKNFKINHYEVTNLNLNKFSRNYFDYIFLHHSLEHVPLQNEIMQNLNNLLAPNGTIFIRIPLSDSFSYKFYKKYWYQLDAPLHLFLHTKKSLTLLANKHQFIVSKILYDSSDVQFFHSSEIKKGIPFEQHHRPKNMINRLEKFFQKIMATIVNYLKVGDQAIFVLKKSCKFGGFFQSTERTRSFINLK